MNSLLQQLFLIPQFRNGIFLATTSHVQSKQTNLLYQLQSLFAFLQEATTKFYDTAPFCKTIFWEGRLINTSQQMDCNEFSNLLFDHLETELQQSGSQVDLLQKTFLGSFTNQFISRECPHRSESPEPFYTLSVEMKRQKNLKGALDSFIEGGISFN